MEKTQSWEKPLWKLSFGVWSFSIWIWFPKTRPFNCLEDCASDQPQNWCCFHLWHDLSKFPISPNWRFGQTELLTSSCVTDVLIDYPQYQSIHTSVMKVPEVLVHLNQFLVLSSVHIQVEGVASIVKSQDTCLLWPAKWEGVWGRQ